MTKRGTLYAYEFEILQGEKYLLAFPFDFAGGTQGESIKDVTENAADWLKMQLEERLMSNIEIPAATYGNEPKEGGRVLLVAIEASLDTIDAVPAYKAAEMLGVSRGRVTQMVGANLLDGFRKGRDAYVTIDSVNARLKESPKPGRPRREKVTSA